jgi:hypothetical protein
MVPSYCGVETPAYLLKANLLRPAGLIVIGAIRVGAGEPFALAFAYDSGACIADVAQAGGFGGLG